MQVPTILSDDYQVTKYTECTLLLLKLIAMILAFLIEDIII